MTSKRPVSSRSARSSFLLDRQKSMVMKAAEEGLSNLVVMALDINPKEDARRLAEPADLQHVPLVTACLKGHLDVVKNLMERCNASLSECRANITIEEEDCKGVTPLWAACYRGNFDLVKYLVAAGADVNTTTDNGSTPLRAGAGCGFQPIVQFLVDSGADVNSITSNGTSVLMRTCYMKRHDVASYLITKGADVNYVNPDNGYTALHENCKEGVLEMVKLLLQRGASMSIRDKSGKTPLLVAAYEGRADIVNFMLDISDFSRDDKADALELLGEALQEKGDVDGCLEVWKRAMEERQQPGRAVAWKRKAERKVAAYHNATEIQTMEELKALQSSRDQDQLAIQCMLIAERVLGKESKDTTHIIKYQAAACTDNKRYGRAIELLQHAIENMSGVFPFQAHICNLYAFGLDIIASPLQTDGDDGDRTVPSPTYTQYLRVLQSAVSGFNRGDADPKNDQSEETNARRYQFLKIILQLICLFRFIDDRATSQELQKMKQEVAAFVKTGVRGQSGDTLLHMACDQRTTDFDLSNKDPYTAFQFPDYSTTEVLLEAGSDASVRNEAGKTALQVLREQVGDHSEIIELLVDAARA